MEYVCKINSPVGELTASSDGTSITGLWLDGQKYFEAGLSKSASEKNLPVFEDLKKWLKEYFSKKNPPMNFKVLPEGTPFRKAVWEILFEIPYGETITYKYIADKLSEETGKKQSARAVGGAVGHNPISILIPCHRVIGSNGGLTGYAGGIDKKIKLLEIEGIISKK